MKIWLLYLVESHFLNIKLSLNGSCTSETIKNFLVIFSSVNGIIPSTTETSIRVWPCWWCPLSLFVVISHNWWSCSWCSWPVHNGFITNWVINITLWPLLWPVSWCNIIHVWLISELTIWLGWFSSCLDHSNSTWNMMAVMSVMMLDGISSFEKD